MIFWSRNTSLSASDWLRSSHPLRLWRALDGGFFSSPKHSDPMGAGLFPGVPWSAVDGLDLLFKSSLEFGPLIPSFTPLLTPYSPFLTGFLISSPFLTDSMDSLPLLMLLSRRSWRGLESRLLRLPDGGLLTLSDNSVSLLCWSLELLLSCRCLVTSSLLWTFSLSLLPLSTEIFLCIVGLFSPSLLRDDFLWSPENSLDLGISSFNEY